MLYVVFGMSGEFTGRTEWAVCYRENEADARTIRDRCAAEAQAFYAKHPGHMRLPRHDVLADLEQMFDPAFDWLDLSDYIVVPVSDDPAELHRFNQLRGHFHQLKDLRDQERGRE